MDKSPDAFRTISEVAADLDLPQHVLRFWETRFAQIKPLKRGGGRRYYRPDDVELLKGIRHLLYGEGYTIRGVQRILKEQGVRFVMNVWQDGAPQPPPTGAAWEEPGHRDDPAFEDEGVEETVELPPDDAYSPYAPHHLAPARSAEPIRPEPVSPIAEPRYAPPPAAGHDDLRPVAAATEDDGEGFAAMAQRFAPRFVPVAEPEPVEPPPPPPLSRATPRPVAEPRRIEPEALAPPPVEVETLPDFGGLRAPRPVAEPPRAEPAEHRGGIGQFFDRLRPGAGREPELAAPRTVQTLSRDEIRRLQSTLFELLECKRLLDQMR